MDLLTAHRYNAAVFPTELDLSIVTHKLEKKTDISKRQLLQELASLAIPDFSQLSLPDILDLRKDASIQAFRRKISTMSSSVLSNKYQSPKEVEDAIKDAIKSSFMRDIFELVRNKKTDVKKSVAKLIGEWKLRKRHGWIFFVSKIRSKALGETRV